MNRALKFRRKLWGVAAFVIAILGFVFYLALRSASQTESLSICRPTRKKCSTKSTKRDSGDRAS